MISKLSQWLKLIFLDKVKLRFSSHNSDMVQITITPKLLSRIINRLGIEQYWMERVVNDSGHVSWVAKLPEGYFIVTEKYVFHGILARAHKRHLKSLECMPDTRLLRGNSSSRDTVVKPEGKIIDVN